MPNEYEFKFNELGVCLNPLHYGEILNPHGISFNYINVARTANGEWCYGYTIQEPSGVYYGSGTPCSSIRNKYHDNIRATKREAVIAACQQIMAEISKQPRYKQRFKDALLCIEKAKQELMNEAQLTLFEI